MCGMRRTSPRAPAPPAKAEPRAEPAPRRGIRVPARASRPRRAGAGRRRRLDHTVARRRRVPRARRGAAFWALRGGTRPRPRRSHVVRDEGPARRILVVANETVAGDELHDAPRAQGGRLREDVLVVCPALNSQAPHVDVGRGRRPRRRAGAARREPGRLADDGINARGEIGDGDPLQALEDALRVFPADEIVVSTHPPGRSNWLEHGVVEQASLRFDVPVTHVVVDLGARRSLAPRRPSCRRLGDERARRPGSAPRSADP